MLKVYITGRRASVLIGLFVFYSLLVLGSPLFSVIFICVF